MLLAFGRAQSSVLFDAAAPAGTGLEWLTVGSILIPAVLLVVLVYVGAENTV
jgi:hypothetical protein